MSVRTETFHVTGIRCERCVMRLGAALERVGGIEAANANLMGAVVLSWDDERTTREDVVEAMARAAFRELESV